MADVLDILKGAIENNPTAIQSAFDDVVTDRIQDRIDARREEILNASYEEEDEDLDVEAEEDDIDPEYEEDLETEEEDA